MWSGLALWGAMVVLPGVSVTQLVVSCAGALVAGFCYGELHPRRR